MIKSWQLRNNAIQPASPSATPSTFKHLIPSISVLNFPVSTAAAPTNDSSDQDADLPPPPLFDCNDDSSDHLLNDAHCECPRAIRPVQILKERLEAWHLLTKQLTDHFVHWAATESQVAKAYERVSNAEDPGSSTASFLESHFTCMQGIQKICTAWETHHADTAKAHATLANYLGAHVIPALATMKRELKCMIRSVHSDDRLRLSTLAKLRREAKRRMQRLERQLAFFEQYPHYGHAKQDPWLVNATVVQQMLKVYHQTNKMHETVLRLQKEVMISEQQFIQQFKQLCQDIYKVREQTALSVDPAYERMVQAVEAVATDADWLDFVEQNKPDLIPENARFLHPDQLEYANHTHPLVQPVFAARMERNSNFFRRWHEYIYVLTPAGFLHEYKSSRSYPNKPDASIFVPNYNVSTLSTNLHHNLIFQLQARERNHLQEYMPSPSSYASSTASSSASFASLMPTGESRGRRNNALSARTLTFRAKSASDMQAWLEHLTELSYRYRPSVSYSAPPFLQPHNATNPDVLITSPTMTVVDKQQQSSSAHVATATPQEGESCDPTTSSVPENDPSGSNTAAPQDVCGPNSPLPLLSGCQSESSSSTKDRPFVLMGVCLPEDMQ